MKSAVPWCAALVVLPAFVIGTSYLRMDVERLRRVVVILAVLMLLGALVIPLSPSLRSLSILAAPKGFPGGGDLVRTDTFSSALLPFAAAMWLLTVAVTPRATLDRKALRRTALVTLLTVASFLTESAILLLVLSLASVATFFSAIADPTHRVERRPVAVYLGLSTLFFGAGVTLLVVHRFETAAMWLIVVAALIRKGIFPFHAWLPEVFDHGRLGPAILFNAPQVGAYMTVVLIVPRGYSPERAEEAPPPNEQVMRLVMSGADLAWWLAMRLARSKVVQFLGVPPAVEARASPAERERVTEIIKSIQPLSMRIAGIRNEAAIKLDPLPLERIAAPTLVISARDDLYNTLPAAEHLAEHIPSAKLIVLDSGGHLMVGHGREVDGAIADFLESC